MRAHRTASVGSCALLCCLLAACGGDKTADAGAQGDDGLPKPTRTGQSVTGMPDPGVASARPANAQSPAAVEMPDEGETDAAMPGDASDNPDPAIAVVRDYYAAINARDFAAAYAQWGDGGRASNQSPEQFAAGFAGTEGASVQVGAAGRVEGAAGSRYVEIPVTLDARQADGSVRRYAGSYTLRMSVVDGATEEQRHWHIASADLREIQQ